MLCVSSAPVYSTFKTPEQEFSMHYGKLVFGGCVRFYWAAAVKVLVCAVDRMSCAFAKRS